jgi:hypothetical protein
MALKLKRPDSEISLSKIPDPGSPTHVSESLVVNKFCVKNTSVYVKWLFFLYQLKNKIIFSNTTNCFASSFLLLLDPGWKNLRSGMDPG